METLNALSARRSIRRFKPDALPRETLEAILQAGIQAPSAKNRQPWKFVVVTEDKAGLISAFREGLDDALAHAEQYPYSGAFIAASEHSLRIMEQAPANILIFNRDGQSPWDVQEQGVEARFQDLANVQSIGAAIENMTLAAVDCGLGSLWICDIFFADREIRRWAGEECQLAAALSLGYPAESPEARPRTPMGEVIDWR